MQDGRNDGKLQSHDSNILHCANDTLAYDTSIFKTATASYSHVIEGTIQQQGLCSTATHGINMSREVSLSIGRIVQGNGSYGMQQR